MSREQAYIAISRPVFMIMFDASDCHVHCTFGPHGKLLYMADKESVFLDKFCHLSLCSKMLTFHVHVQLFRILKDFDIPNCKIVNRR